MERLTKWGEFQANVVVHEDETMNDAVFEIVQKLAHYEDLEEQGRLIKLPCKVGTVVYQINTTCTYGEIGDKPTPHYYIYEEDFDVDLFDDFGKTVFLTKEEAEQALAEMKGNKRLNLMRECAEEVE